MILLHALEIWITIWRVRNLILQGETQVAYYLDDPILIPFSAIRDSGYKHALRLYRDTSTNAVRLEASVLDREMKE